jgi:hypothetical protein
MGLIKNILLVIGIGVFLVAFRMCQVSENGGGKSASGGFVELPRPSNAPATKVLLIGPKNCPKEVGVRIDSLERTIHAAGIPCVRLDSVSIAPSTQAEADRVRKVMTGDLPIVFVGHYATNNPSLEEIKTQFQSGRK